MKNNMSGSLGRNRVAAPIFRTKTLRNDEARRYGTTNGANGFTLIELLVVVLIIGVLAAVALPQYQKAVLRGRFSQLLVSIRALRDAEYRFRLANGVYTQDRDNLDIEFPGSDTSFPNSKYRLKMKNGFCGIEGTSATPPSGQNNIYCQLDSVPQISLSYSLDDNGRRTCCNFTLNNTYADELCQKETSTKILYGSSSDRRCYKEAHGSL